MSFTSGNIYYAIGSGASNTNIVTTPQVTYGTSTADYNYAIKPMISRCAKDGHTMHDEVEWLDGSVRGICEVCGEIIHGRRIAGGIGVANLKALLSSLIDGGVSRDVMLKDVLRLTKQLEAEERALEEARSMLRVAQKALLSGKAAA